MQGPRKRWLLAFQSPDLWPLNISDIGLHEVDYGTKYLENNAGTYARDIYSHAVHLKQRLIDLRAYHKRKRHRCCWSTEKTVSVTVYTRRWKTSVTSARLGQFFKASTLHKYSRFHNYPHSNAENALCVVYFCRCHIIKPKKVRFSESGMHMILNLFCILLSKIDRIRQWKLEVERTEVNYFVERAIISCLYYKKTEKTYSWTLEKRINKSDLIEVFNTVKE